MNTSLGTYRLGGGRVVAWWIIAIVAVMAVSGLVTETGRNRVISVALCLAVICISYVLGVRPAVMEGPDELRVLNPIRTVHIAWSSIVDVHVKDVIIIETDQERIRCYALPRRDRRSAASVVNSTINSRIPMGSEPPSAAANLSRSVVDLIRDHAQVLGVGESGGPPVSRTVDRDVVVVLVTFALALSSVGFSIWA